MEPFNLELFEFVDRHLRRSKSTFPAIFSRLVTSRVALMGSPVVYRSGAESGRKTLIEELCSAINLDTSALPGILVYHHERLKLRSRVRRVVYYVLVMVLLGTVSGGLFGLARLIKPLSASIDLSGPLISFVIKMAILYPMIILFTLVTARIALRIALAITNKDFAESLCAMIVIFIVIELSRDDVLTHPIKRKVLIARINDLARVTRLLPFRFANKNESNQDWLRKHFHHMQHYVLERARWATAPQEQTLADLRNDFYQLAAIYVEGSYGKFRWATSDSQSDEEERLTWKSRAIQGTPRILGLVLPLMLMGYFLWQPKYLQAIGVGSNLVALVFIAWLLLAIDSSLKLGVVAGVVNLAKEIKNLK